MEDGRARQFCYPRGLIPLPLAKVALSLEIPRGTCRAKQEEEEDTEVGVGPRQRWISICMEREGREEERKENGKVLPWG